MEASGACPRPGTAGHPDAPAGRVRGRGGPGRVRTSPPSSSVTAHDQYAVRAFEIHAFDYLLKPADQEAAAGGHGMGVIRHPSRVSGEVGPGGPHSAGGLNARDRARGRDRLVVRDTGVGHLPPHRDDPTGSRPPGNSSTSTLAAPPTRCAMSMAELEQELDSKTSRAKHRSCAIAKRCKPYLLFHLLLWLCRIRPTSIGGTEFIFGSLIFRRSECMTAHPPRQADPRSK